MKRTILIATAAAVFLYQPLIAAAQGADETPPPRNKARVEQPANPQAPRTENQERKNPDRDSNGKRGDRESMTPEQRHESRDKRQGADGSRNGSRNGDAQRQSQGKRSGRSR
jgi:hypothetical protein